MPDPGARIHLGNLTDAHGKRIPVYFDHGGLDFGGRFTLPEDEVASLSGFIGDWGRRFEAWAEAEFADGATATVAGED